MTRSENIRRDFKKNDDIRDAGLSTPEAIMRFDDICYGENETWHMLDVYRPKSVSGELPVIISVHGGGWVYGDKERYQYYCMELALQGFAVVNYTYRLAPEYKFPAPIEDTAKVFEWVLDNASKYEFDVKHVFAVGDSAGAHILGMYMALLTNIEYESILVKDYGINLSHKIVTRRQIENLDLHDRQKELVVNAVGLNCGIYKLESGDELLYDYLENHGNKKEIDYIDITRYINKDFPDAYMMTCYGDFLMNQPKHMIRIFENENVPYVHKVYGSADNELTHVFHCDIRSEAAKLCNKEQCEYFKTFT
ncbi:MAG: alpha/beta hydrolase [Lachnospiraceae bacterium]|nr:alpha/beta hydrolase [Lachnospiraceae bacterium]